MHRSKRVPFRNPVARTYKCISVTAGHRQKGLDRGKWYWTPPSQRTCVLALPLDYRSCLQLLAHILPPLLHNAERNLACMRSSQTATIDTCLLAYIRDSLLAPTYLLAYFCLATHLDSPVYSLTC